MFTHEPQEATAMLEAGVYDATIHSAEEKTSKKGSPMIELCLDVYAPSGEPVPVYDYLVSAPKAAWKIRNFCEAIGLDYEAGAIDAEALVDQNIKVKIGVEKQEGYDPKNKVITYIAKDQVIVSDSPPPPTGRPQPDIDSDIPFSRPASV